MTVHREPAAAETPFGRRPALPPRCPRVRLAALPFDVEPADVDPERRDEVSVEIDELGRRKTPGEVREPELRRAHERITMHAAVVAQSFVGPDGHLGGQPVPGGVDGST
jgi:hypothetical protein